MKTTRNNRSVMSPPASLWQLSRELFRLFDGRIRFAISVIQFSFVNPASRRSPSPRRCPRESKTQPQRNTTGYNRIRRRTTTGAMLKIIVSFKRRAEKSIAQGETHTSRVFHLCIVRSRFTGHRRFHTGIIQTKRVTRRRGFHAQ